MERERESGCLDAEKLMENKKEEAKELRRWSTNIGRERQLHYNHTNYYLK